MRFDRPKIEKLVSSFRSAVTQLKRLAASKQEEFVNDPDKAGSAKYYFIIAIEAAVDICQHLIAKNGFRIPEDYADAFRVLGEAGVLPADFVPTLVQAAKFRNRLVHLYWDVDNALVYQILQQNLGDLDRFLTELGKVLRSMQ